jgi:energy-coupling factor transporter transmembrane protein EcfT
MFKKNFTANKTIFCHSLNANNLPPTKKNPSGRVYHFIYAVFQNVRAFFILVSTFQRIPTAANFRTVSCGSKNRQLYR